MTSSNISSTKGPAPGGRGAVAPKSGGSQPRNMTGPDDIAVLWIELEEIEPLIWRRIAVRTSMNLKGIV